MITVDIKLQKIEVDNFDRKKGVSLKLYFNDGNDETKNISYIPIHPGDGAEEILNKLRNYEKKTRQEQGDLDDPLAGIVHVNFVDEEKTTKTLAGFLSILNDKLFYINKSSNAGDHMTLVQALQNLKMEF